MKKLLDFKHADKYFLYTGFILLGIFSIVFAKERIINSDAAFYLFKLINFEHFNIEHGRYSAFISQLFILPFIKAGVNIDALIVIYSLSFIVLFFLVAFFLVEVLNNYAAGFTILLLILVGVSHSSYRPVSESTQGIVYSLLLFGVLYYKTSLKISRQIIYIILSVLIIILCYFSHPITVFPLVFIIGFYIIDQKKYKDPFPYLLLIAILIIYSYKFVFAHNTSYEEDKMSSIGLWAKNLKNFFHLYPTRFIIHRLHTLYFIPALMFTTLIVLYIKKSQYLKLVYLAAFVFGFIIVHNLIYFDGASNIEHEKNLIVANFFIFLAFSKDFFCNNDIANTKAWTLKPVIYILIIAFSAFITLYSSSIYTKRIAYLENLSSVLSDKDGTKFYTLDAGLDQDQTLFLWSVPVETLLISSSSGPEKSKTIYSFKDSAHIPEYMSEPDIFLCAHFWLRWNINVLNPDYFKLENTPYTYLNPDSLKLEVNKRLQLGRP